MISNTVLHAEKTELAKGTISAGSGRRGPCQHSLKCHRTVYHADLKKTLDHHTAGGPSPALIFS